MFTNESNFKNVSRQERQDRKGFLGELCVFARENIFSYSAGLRLALASIYLVNS